MKETLSGKPIEDFPVPEGIVVVPVNLSASSCCAKPVMMTFLAGTEPRNICGPARATPRPDHRGEQKPAEQRVEPVQSLPIKLRREGLQGFTATSHSTGGDVLDDSVQHEIVGRACDIDD